MKRSRILFLVPLVLALLLSACAFSAGNADVSAGGAAASPQSPEFSAQEKTNDSAVGSETASDEPVVSTEPSHVYTDADAKLIRQASLTVQTVDFPAALAALDALTVSLDGYYENAQTQAGGYYDTTANRYAYYTVRVPQENYDAFLNATGNIGHVVSTSESSTDVGDQYYDTELRLKTLQTKQERLLALMEKADRMEDIITLENSLSDVQYEIERLTSTLKRYDGLVDFATINVQINEVIKLSEDPGETASLGTRLLAALKNGFSDFGTALGNAMVWAAYHLVGIFLFTAAAAIIAVLAYRVRRRRKNTPPQ